MGSKGNGAVLASELQIDPKMASKDQIAVKKASYESHKHSVEGSKVEDIGLKKDNVSVNIDPELSDLFNDYYLTGNSPTYIRHAFVRKVFFIVGLQLLASFTFMLVSYFIEPIKEFMATHDYIGFVAGGIFILMLIAIAIKPNMTRGKTGGIVFLTLSTVLMTLFLTTVCCRFDIKDIIGAMGITFAVVLGLTLFALQTKYDFTSWIGYFFTFGCAIVAFAIFAVIFHSRVLTMIITGLGSLLVCFYILVDVQLIAGGKKKYQFSVDEYCMAAIVLYSDIISLFIHLLTLIYR